MSIENSPQIPARRSLVRAGLLVSAMTMASRFLGLLRDAMIAVLFGASGATDAFFVAFRIPNLFRRMFAEGAFSQGFVPVLAQVRTEQGEPAAQNLIDRTFGAGLMVLVPLTVLGIFAAPLLILLFAPGFSSDAVQFQSAVDLLQLTFPYLLCISLVALSAGVHNSYGRFGVPAATPVLMNVVFISAMALYWGQSPHIMLLGWAVLIAGLVQLLFQVPSLVSLRRLPRPRSPIGDAGVYRIAALMGPALFGASVAQINLLIDTLLASLLASGSISWLYYADRLMELPVGLVAVALGTVVLPTLSARHVSEDQQGFAKALDWGVRCALLLALPAAVALYIMAVPLIAGLFRYGAMGAEDVVMAARALQAFALGVPGFVLVKVLAPGYFSRQNTVTPVRIAMIAVAANIALNLLLISWLAHVGLALATAVSGLLNAGLLWAGLLRGRVYQFTPGWLKYLLAMGLGLLCMSATLVMILPADDYWYSVHWIPRLARLLGISGAGAAVYFAAAFIVGIRPADFRGPALSR